jgi:hypothetical protein
VENIIMTTNTIDPKPKRTRADTARYAEILRNVMLRHGVLREIERGKYKVVSNDYKKVAGCFEQAEHAFRAAVAQFDTEHPNH